MSDKIYFRGGLAAARPTLDPREPGFDLDKKQLFIGSSSGNVALPIVLGGGFKIQTGQSSGIVTTANTSVQVTITFPIAFGAVPLCYASFAAPGATDAGYVNIRAAATATTMTVTINCYLAQSIVFNWLAIGN